MQNNQKLCDGYRETTVGDLLQDGRYTSFGEEKETGIRRSEGNRNR